MKIDEKEKETPAVTVGAWHGKPNFSCGRCVYNTLNLETFLNHMRAAHGLTFTGPIDPDDEQPGEPAEDGEL